MTLETSNVISGIAFLVVKDDEDPRCFMIKSMTDGKRRLAWVAKECIRYASSCILNTSESVVSGLFSKTLVSLLGDLLLGDCPLPTASVVGEALVEVGMTISMRAVGVISSIEEDSLLAPTMISVGIAETLLSSLTKRR